jgi:hypothetical protein
MIIIQSMPEDSRISSVPNPMIAHESGFIGQAGINLIATVVNAMRHLWTPTPQQSDLGIDGFIELCEDTPEGKRKGTGFVVKVQSKATGKPWPQEDENGFVFNDIPERSLHYWLQSNEPVILVVSRPDTNEAYWISVQHYFRSIESRRSRAVHFRKQQHRFNESIDLKLRDLAVPADAALRTDPLRKAEVLDSNLLEVIRYPTTIYSAQSALPDFDSIQARLKELNTYLARGWFLKKKTLFGFRPMDHAPWFDIIKGGVTNVDSAKWALSNDLDTKRDFVRLLNEGIASFLGARGLWKFVLPTGKLLYYFAPATDAIERRVVWGERNSERAVVQKVHSKMEPTRVLCYRHLALFTNFVRFGDKWFLVIDPSYHFTRDGEKEYPLREEYLSGMKRLEKHQAVSNNVRFLAHFLTHIDLLEQRNDMLAFARPNQFGTEFGIPDADWLTKADAEERERIGAEPSDDEEKKALVLDEQQMQFGYAS